MNILVIGGTRNVGHLLAMELLNLGHQVTVFNRGKTRDELPSAVRRLHGDRTDPVQLAKGLIGKSYDSVIDMALYKEQEAKHVIELLNGRVGQYIFISSGQVYLVRGQAPRPFGEEMYERPLLPRPPLGTRDYEEWLYGSEKSRAEDVFIDAWQADRFPFTTLRLPMVNSERDPFHRIYNYLLRLQDGGPILLPAGNHQRLRHVYAGDVVQAILRAIAAGAGTGHCYNISQDETVSMENFLNLLAGIAGFSLKISYLAREILEGHGLIPDCSPFSDPWMSELDNQRSKLELGMQYTPLPIYLKDIVRYYTENQVSIAGGYQRRSEELGLAQENGKHVS